MRVRVSSITLPIYCCMDTHAVRDVDHFETFLGEISAAGIRLVKYERHPAARDIHVLTAVRHDSPHIYRHHLDEGSDSEVRDLLAIARFTPVRGQWTPIAVARLMNKLPSPKVSSVLR